MDNKGFKNLLIKRSYCFSIKVIKIVDELDNRKLSNHIIAKQVLRSATSIGANIVEAQASSSKKDFTNFINHALKSSNETKYWIAILREINIDKKIFNDLLREAIELSKILGSAILSLRGKNNNLKF